MAGKKGYEGCEICGKELLLFKCKYCGKAFCEHHKAPEKHECAGLADYRRLQAMGVIAKPGGTAASAEKSVAPAGPKTPASRPSTNVALHRQAAVGGRCRSRL